MQDGDSFTKTRPAGATKGIKSIYVSSSNLTYATVETDKRKDDVPKSANFKYNEGFFPLMAEASSFTITIYGPSSAEDVIVWVEWE